MVNMGELFAHPRLCNAQMDRVPLSHSESERFLLNEGDLLFARQSLVLEGAGKCSIFLGDDEAVTFESHVTRVRLDPTKADPSFYFYYLQSHHGRAAIRSIVEQGAGASGIRGSNLESLDVLWRPLPEQHAIAHILGTLDDKIELNRRMNKTLEAIARALFKSWFVDFDPVRAKAEGRDPGLPKPLADLFPARLVYSVLGQIPEGWGTGSILDQAKLLSGGTPKTDVPAYWDGGILWASAKDVSQSGAAFLVGTERTITTRGLEESAAQIIPALSTAVVARGATTGRMALLGRDMAMNQTCYALTTTSETPFALHYRLQHEIDALVRAAHGSVFDTITTKTFSTAEVVVVPPPLLKAFERKAAPTLQRVLMSAVEAHTLAAVRDTLLPKLISGELRIPEAERLAARYT